MAANNPNNQNAKTVQGPDPTGNQGYPIAVVPATGADPFQVDVTISQTGNYKSASAAFVATGQFIEVDVRGWGNAKLCIATTPTWSGVIQFYGDMEGISFIPIPGSLQSGVVGGNFINGFWGDTFSGGAMGPSEIRYWQFDVAGFSIVRIYAALVTSGQANVVLTVTPFPSDEQPFSQPSNTSTGKALPIVAIEALDFNGGWSPTGIASPFIRFIPESTRCLITASEQCTFSPLNSRFDYVRSIDTYRTVSTAAVGNTALWTPAAGKSFRLMRYMVAVTGDASFAAAANLVVSLFDGAAGATGQVHDIYVPLAAAIVPGTSYTSGWIDLGNGYLSAAVGNVLNVNLSAALATGLVRVICCGTEE